MPAKKLQYFLSVAALISPLILWGYSGGTGSAETPWQIGNKTDLLFLSSHPDHYSSNFVMTADIDLSEEIFSDAVIAPDSSDAPNYQGPAFTGVFNGNGHVISNLVIKISNDIRCTYVGLFGRVDGSGGPGFDYENDYSDLSGMKGAVAHLKLVNVSIKSVGGLYYSAGGVCGSLINGFVVDCCVEGEIEAYDLDAGGVCGVSDKGSIVDCYANAKVFGNYSGGITGYAFHGNVMTCCSKGSVIGRSYAGGCIGDTHGVSIHRSYSSASVSGLGCVGGFVGQQDGGRIMDSYSTGFVVGDGPVGGLVGVSSYHPYVHESFWDMDSSGISVSAGGIGKATSEMQTLSTFQSGGWRFPEDWMMDAYPVASSFYECVELSHITISGLSLIKEGQTRRLYCRAYYDDGTSLDVSALAAWNLVGGCAAISYNGLVTADDVTSNRIAEISAVYYREGVVRTNRIQLTVQDIPAGELYCGGNGSAESPWLIGDREDLLYLGTNTAHYGSNFVMIADIDLSGYYFDRTLIAPSADSQPYPFVGLPFSGVFDGNNKAIRNYKVFPSEYFGITFCSFAVFGSLAPGGVIRHLKIDSFDMFLGSASKHFSGLCAENNGVIHDCQVSGQIRALEKWDTYMGGGVVALNLCEVRDSSSNVSMILHDYCMTIGGFVGHSEGVISNCFSEGCIKTGEGSRDIGGFAGSARGVVSSCSSSCDISCGEFAGFVGGLCGSFEYVGKIDNCFSDGQISCGLESDRVGGLCGTLYLAEITNCYSRSRIDMESNWSFPGGLVGDISEARVYNSFWDTEASGCLTSAAGVGKTTSEMQTKATFTDAGWDLTNVWYMADYPALLAHDQPGTYCHWVVNSDISADRRGIHDDPADDGIPNLIKYATGLKPEIYCTTTDFMAITHSNDNRFSVEYEISVSTHDVRLYPVWTSSLNSSWSENGLLKELLIRGESREKWQASIPIERSGYIRLRADLIQQ